MMMMMMMMMMNRVLMKQFETSNTEIIAECRRFFQVELLLSTFFAVYTKEYSTICRLSTLSTRCAL